MMQSFSLSAPLCNILHFMPKDVMFVQLESDPRAKYDINSARVQEKNTHFELWCLQVSTLCVFFVA